MPYILCAIFLALKTELRKGTQKDTKTNIVKSAFLLPLDDNNY